jgi:zinc and cadmium transporter
LNLASASVAILGTAVALLVGAEAREAVAGLLLPLTAGGFVYLAAADLIPELQHDKSLGALLTQTTLIVAGIAVMGLLAAFE